MTFDCEQTSNRTSCSNLQCHQFKNSQHVARLALLGSFSALRQDFDTIYVVRIVSTVSSIPMLILISRPNSRTRMVKIRQGFGSSIIIAHNCCSHNRFHLE